MCLGVQQSLKYVRRSCRAQRKSPPKITAVYVLTDWRGMRMDTLPALQLLVKNNPEERTIQFGGTKGQDIRQRNMDMPYDAMDNEGHVESLPLFANIAKYTVVLQLKLLRLPSS